MSEGLNRPLSHMWSGSMSTRSELWEAKQDKKKVLSWTFVISRISLACLWSRLQHCGDFSETCWAHGRDETWALFRQQTNQICFSNRTFRTALLFASDQMGFVWPDITRPYTPPPEEPAGSSLRHNLIWIQCGFVEKGVKNELEVNLQQVVKRIKASKRAAVWTTCGATEQYDVYVVTEYDRL